MNIESPISDILKKVFRQMEITDSASIIEIKQAYHIAAGEMLSKLTQDVRFENGTLFLKYNSPALKNEIKYRTTSLTESINKELNAEIVKKIVIL